MAAILCKPITACFEFICTAPFKICSGGCNLCADGLAGLCRNPLAAYVMVTFLTQTPLAVAAVLEIGGLRGGCKGSQWLLGMLVVAIMHMVTSVYLAHRVTNRTDETLRDHHTSWQRISYLLCHDPFIAFYILVICFFIGWLIIGSSWTINDKMEDSRSCGNDLDDRINIVLGLGWFYLFLGPSVLSCNLCCVCCDKTDYAGDDAEFAAKEAEKEAKKQQRKSAATSTNNNNNYNFNNDVGSGDIEAAGAHPSHSILETNSKKEPPTPRTYSVDGVPIPDDGNANVLEAEILEGEDVLPPPIPPPEAGFGGETVAKAQAIAGDAASKAQVTAEKAVKTVNKKVGLWFGKKKKDGDGKPKQPETKATLY